MRRMPSSDKCGTERASWGKMGSMEKERAPLSLGDGWYPAEYDAEMAAHFMWNSHRSSLTIDSDRVTALEFTVKRGAFSPTTVTIAFLDADRKVLSSETRELGRGETQIKVTVPQGARQCLLENDAFVPSMVTYGSVDIRALGLMFVRSIAIHEGTDITELRFEAASVPNHGTANTKTRKGLVSVIFPIYGNFYADRLLLSIASARAQEGINVEIVVAEQGTVPTLEGKLDPSITYLFQAHASGKDTGDFNPGEIRNRAIANASGEFIYTNDADVVFMNKRFLAKSLEILDQNPDMVLHRPPMRRLPIDNFDEFKKRANEHGLPATIASLNLGNEFLATTDHKERDVKVAVSNSEGDLRVRTTSKEDFDRYLSDSSLKENEHVIWSENVHYGGNFFRREQFESIGGYCERYINWGCEDTDLQWKFKNMFNLQLFPKIAEFTVLHLDHEKRYLLAETVRRNEGVFERRRQGGVYAAIKEDRENGKVTPK